MLRKVVAASLVLVLSVGFIFAEEIAVSITKVEGNKVSYYKTEGKGRETKRVGVEITLHVAKNAKIVTMKRNPETKKFEAGDQLEGGLKHKMFSNIDSEKGRRATIVTEGNKITEIRVFQRKGKGKQ